MCPSSEGHDPAALRTRFDAEVQVAGIVVGAADRQALFTLWAAHLPIRERLSTAEVALEEEPSFTQKPTQPGGGIIVGSPGPAGAGADALSGGAL